MSNDLILKPSKVDSFVEEKVNLILSCINVKRDESILVSRNLINKDGDFLFNHSIYVGILESIYYDTDKWENSELFIKSNANLFLYLKGRLLIQTTTTWSIYAGVPFCRQYEIPCKYSIKD